MSPGLHAPLRARRGAFRPSARAWFVLASVALVLNAAAWWRFAPRGSVRLGAVPLQVVATSPNRFAQLDPQVLVAFDRPMATPAERARPIERPLITLSPRVPGVARWISDREGSFRPSAPLRKATSYTVVVSPEVRGLDGSALAEPVRFSFDTPCLTLLSAAQAGPAEAGVLPLRLEFDDDVSAAKLREKVDLHDEHGGTLEFDLAESGIDRTFTLRVRASGLEPSAISTVSRPTPPAPFGSIQPPVPAGDLARIHLHVAAGLAGMGGPLPMAETRREVEVSSTTLRVVDARADARQAGDAAVQLRFSDAVDADAARASISVSPPVAFRVETAYDGLSILGPFRSGDSYTVTLAAGLTSVHGMRLAQEVSLPAVFPDRPVSIRFAHPGQVLSRAGNRELFVDSVNAPTAQVSVFRVYANNLVPFLRRSYRDYGSNSAEQFGFPVAEEKVTIEDKLNQPVRTAVDLGKLLDGRPNGAYLVTVADLTQYSYERDGRIVLSTDLAITTKASGGALVAWVTSLAKAWPVADVEVRVLTRTNQEVARAKTDLHGVASLELPVTGDCEPFLVVASLGDDLSFLRLDEGAWDLRPFSPGGVPTLARGVRAFLFTDRGVYRGGDEVRLAGLLRDPRRLPPAPFPVDLCIERDDRALWRRVRVTPDSEGAFEARLAVPDDARTGMYRAWACIPGETDALGQCLFQVEDFVPERMKVEVEASPSDVVIRARHMFGGPASGRRAEATVEWHGVGYTSKEFPSHHFGDPKRTLPAAAPQSLGDATLDAQGEAHFKVEPPKVQPPAFLEGTVRGTVLEAGGRAACATATVRIPGYPVLIGLAQTGASPEPGRACEIDVVALVEEGRPAPLSVARTRVERVRWVYALRQDDTGVRYDYVRKTDPIAEGEVALVGGRGTWRFTPSEWGDYEVTVEDPAGGMRSAIEVATWGEAEEAAPERETVRLRLDRESYAPGATARVRLEAPFDGTALVAIERERVFAWRVVPVHGRAAEVELPLPDGCGPNLYCTATVVRPVGAMEAWRPHRVFGMATVTMETEAHQLTVEVEAADEARPGTASDVTLLVRSGDLPVRGAVVTVAAVDEGILQLTRHRTPDPFGFFFAKESLQVRSGDLYPLLFPELAGAARSEPGGDEGGEAPLARTAPVRAKRFVSAALWFPLLRTDAEGRVRVKAVLPELVGELRWMAIAAHADAFGSMDRPMRLSKPLLMEVSAPRFAATGDTFLATVTVTNRTAAEGTVHVTCEASDGVASVDGNSRSDLLAAGTERTMRFALRCDGTCGEARLAFRATMGGETAEEAFPLPVRPPCDRTTVSRSGRIDRGEGQPIDVPVSWMEGTGRTRLVLSAKPSVRLAGDLRRLLEYPHGCVEQTTSRAFPLLYVADLLRLAQPDAAPVDVRDLVRAAVWRLQTMQTRSGGLSMWPGEGHPYDWGTAYAGHFLVEAGKAGHEVPSNLMDGVLRYLEAILIDRPTGAESLEVQAYAALVLASAGKARLGDLAGLRERADELSPTARGDLAAALAALGRTHDAASLLSGIALPSGDDRGTGGTLHSSIRDAALLLSVLLDIAPGHPKVGELVDRLEASQAAGDWATTHETAYALVALGKYAAQARGVSGAPMTGDIQVGHTPPHAFRDLDEVIHEWAQDVHGGALVRVEGTGAVFWRWESEGIPDGAVPDVDRGLRVRRAFTDEAGKEISSLRIAQGDLVTVTLTIASDAPYQNCVARELLPAGFEAENPRLASRAPAAGEDTADHAEFRDDRVELFFAARAGTPRVFRYVMRAVTPGRFAMAPSRAECMYDPRPFSRFGGVEWEVTPR